MNVQQPCLSTQAASIPTSGFYFYYYKNSINR